MPYDITKDDFEHLRVGLDAPGSSVVSVTPNDSTDLSGPYPRALYVGVAGDLVVLPLRNVDGQTVTLKNHPVGYCPIRVRRVLATGTSATNILAIT